MPAFQDPNRAYDAMVHRLSLIDHLRWKTGQSPRERPLSQNDTETKMQQPPAGNTARASSRTAKSTSSTRKVRSEVVPLGARSRKQGFRTTGKANTSRHGVISRSSGLVKQSSNYSRAEVATRQRSESSAVGDEPEPQGFSNGSVDLDDNPRSAQPIQEEPVLAEQPEELRLMPVKTCDTSDSGSETDMAYYISGVGPILTSPWTNEDEKKLLDGLEL